MYFEGIFLTFGILGCLLFAYKTRIIKPTENFKLGIFAATGGIFLVYLGGFIHHRKMMNNQKIEIGNIITNQTNFNLNQKGKKL